MIFTALLLLGALKVASPSTRSCEQNCGLILYRAISKAYSVLYGYLLTYIGEFIFYISFSILISNVLYQQNYTGNQFINCEAEKCEADLKNFRFNKGRIEIKYKRNLGSDSYQTISVFNDLGQIFIRLIIQEQFILQLPLQSKRV